MDDFTRGDMGAVKKSLVGIVLRECFLMSILCFTFRSWEIEQTEGFHDEVQEKAGGGFFHGGFI